MSGGSSSFGENVNQISALVVDDDRVIRTLHAAMLKALGVKVHLAVNGKEAVDLFRSGVNIHIVFMDLEMPVMNGIEVNIYKIHYHIFHYIIYRLCKRKINPSFLTTVNNRQQESCEQWE